MAIAKVSLTVSAEILPQIAHLRPLDPDTVSHHEVNSWSPMCAWAPPHLWVWQNLLDSDVSASLGTRVSLGIPVSAACLSTWDAAKQTRFLQEPSPLPSCLWHTVRAVLRQYSLCLGILQRFGQAALWVFTYWLPVLWCVGQEAHWREGWRTERVRPRTNPLLYSGLPLSLRMNVSFLDMNDLPVGFSSPHQNFLLASLLVHSTSWNLLQWAHPNSLVAQSVKNLPAMQETRVQSVGGEDPLEEGMATQSSILAWRIPCTEEPGGLQSIRSHRVKHDWSDLAHTQGWAKMPTKWGCVSVWVKTTPNQPPGIELEVERLWAEDGSKSASGEDGSRGGSRQGVGEIGELSGNIGVLDPFTQVCLLPAERHLRVVEGPPSPSQVLGDGRWPAQCPPGLLLLPHRLAVCPQASGRHWEGEEAWRHRLAGWPRGPVPEKVSEQSPSMSLRDRTQRQSPVGCNNIPRQLPCRLDLLRVTLCWFIPFWSWCFSLFTHLFWIWPWFWNGVPVSPLVVSFRPICVTDFMECFCCFPHSLVHVSLGWRGGQRGFALF